MDPEDNMEVPQEETTPEAETTAAEVPAEETTPEQAEAAPAEEAPAETTPAAEPELFELPDGRKVEAAELSTLWREHFYPEYTKKSQDLAALTRGPQQQTPEQTTDPLEDPNYIPPTYGELAAQIEQRILGGMQERQQQEAAAKQALEDNAIAQLTEVKAADPTVNEARLFQHAMKYQFTDLRLAHASMRDMDEAVKAAMTHTKESAAGRVDPVSSRPGAAAGGTLDPDSFASSVDYLRALKAQGK